MIYIMPYVLDENDNHILDNNSNKIEFNISYTDSNDWYNHKEPLHINDDGHLDTEDSHIIIKEGIKDDHAVCKKQLDEINDNKYSKQDVDNKLSALHKLINSSIQNLIKAHETKIFTQMIHFRNEQVMNRFHKKQLVIPQKINTWIELLNNTELPFDAPDLNDIVIFNTWIERYNRFHHAKSALVEGAFKHIEFFFSSDMKRYYTYFSHVPARWSLRCIIEYIRIPKPILIDNENIPDLNSNDNNANR